MHYAEVHLGPATVAQVLARLQAPADWDWLDATVEAAPKGCWVRFGGPRPLAMRLEVEPTPDGIRVKLVEGDLTQLDSELSVQASGEGSELTWRLELSFPVSIPGTLLRELDGRLLPQWAAALLRAE